MTNEELLAKLENATDDETVELLKEYAEKDIDDNEELTQEDLEDVAGGAVSVTSISAIYRRFNRLSNKEKQRWKKKLKELIRMLSKWGNVKIPF